MATAFPDAATLDSVLDLAARAPSVRNIQPWRWHVDRRGVQLMADWSRRLGDTDSDRRDVIVSCGAVLHHCAIAFAAAGWSSRIRRFPDDGVLATMEVDKRSRGPGSATGADATRSARRCRRAGRRAVPGGHDRGWKPRPRSPDTPSAPRASRPSPSSHRCRVRRPRRAPPPARTTRHIVSKGQ